VAGAVERIKPVFWMGSSRADLKAFPEPVQSNVGYALFAAQRGEEYRSVKSLQGFGGRGVLEIVVPHDGDAYRAVYTVRFRDSIYVLHAFQKKSTRRIATPKREIELVRRRLADAERHHQERLKAHGEEEKD
jgi:phage-related protein